MKRTKTTIIYTTRETLVVKRSGTRLGTGWCIACDAETETLTHEETALILDVDPCSIPEQISEGLIHFIGESNQFQPLICLNSVRRQNISIDLRLDEKK